MFEKIEKLLYQRYVLHKQKFTLIRQLNVRSYVHSVASLHRMQSVLKKEILLNKKLYNILQKEDFPEEIKKTFVREALHILLKINILLKRENAVLCKTTVLRYGFSVAQKLFTGKQKDFQFRLKQFHALAEKELLLHQELFFLSQKIAKHSVDQEKVKRSWKLVQDLQQELRLLGKSIGNSKLVQKHGEHVLILIGKIQKTEIYDFIQQDVISIQTKVKYIMAHPKEHKLAYFLTTVYIVAPFTFEMTGVILFFRYLGKYTTKKIQQKFTSKKV